MPDLYPAQMIHLNCTPFPKATSSRNSTILVLSGLSHLVEKGTRVTNAVI